MDISNLDNIKQELSDLTNSLSSYKTEDWGHFPSIDLYMDQVITYLEKLLNIFGDIDDKNKVITSSMVNNYVKEGYLKRPVNKKYDRNHLVSLYIMSMLKPILPIPLIAGSLNNFESEQQYQDFFKELTRFQDEAFLNVSDKLNTVLAQANDDDFKNSLRLFALQLTSEANARRIAAEHILYALQNNQSKPTEKK